MDSRHSLIQGAMSRQRDHKAEYRRRLKRAAARGLSRSQARGHARAGEKPIRGTKSISTDERLEAALKLLRNVNKQGLAARTAGVSPERFRRFLRENSLAARKGRSWVISDRRPYRMTVITEREVKNLTFDDFEQRSVNGRYLAAVQQFLRTNDIGLLRPFEGHAVIDAKGRPHLLETDPNTLHRLASAGSEMFHEVYRLVQ
jgi:hypothetical protein